MCELCVSLRDPRASPRPVTSGKAVSAGDGFAVRAERHAENIALSGGLQGFIYQPSALADVPEDHSAAAHHLTVPSGDG